MNKNSLISRITIQLLVDYMVILRIIKYSGLSILLVLLTASSLLAHVEITSFFDALYKCQLDNNDKSNVEYGQLEIGFAKSINNYFDIEATVTFNNESEKL